MQQAVEEHLERRGLDGMRALLVAVDGQLVLERYWDSDPDEHADTLSVTKTITGTLVGAALAPLLRVASEAVADGRDGAWIVDDQGQGQPLVSCLAVAPLRAAMPAEPRDRPLHQVLARLRLDRVNAPEGSVSDVDTPQDLADIRQDLHRQHGKDTHE